MAGCTGMTLKPVTIREVMEWKRTYETGAVSLMDIATAAGRARATVHRHLSGRVAMRRTGVSVCGHPNRLPHAVFEQTVDLYLNEKLPPRVIAERLGVAEGTVRYRLKQAGVPLRTRSTALRSAPSARRLSATVHAQVLAMHDAGAIQTEIASALGIHSDTVYRILMRYGRPARSRSYGAARRRALNAGRVAPMAVPDPATLPPLPPRVDEPEAPGRRRDRCGGYLPSPPLAHVLLVMVDELDMPVGEVCALAGVDVRTLYAWRTGERPTAHLDVADRLLVGLDRLWWDVYDPEMAPGLFADRQRDDVLMWLDAVDRAAQLFEGEGYL